MVELGPDGTFPLGEPIDEEDQGGLYAGFVVLKTNRLGVLNFGKEPLQWFGGPPVIMREFAGSVRQRILEAFGTMPYNKSTLPLKVTPNREKGVILVGLPVPAPMLAANPEMWLALAEVIEEACGTMTN